MQKSETDTMKCFLCISGTFSRQEMNFEFIFLFSSVTGFKLGLAELPK